MCSFIRRGFARPNSATTSATSILKSLWIASRASDDKRTSPIVDLRYVFRHLRRLKLRSHSHDVTGTVRSRWKRKCRFGKITLGVASRVSVKLEHGFSTSDHFTCQRSNSSFNVDACGRSSVNVLANLRAKLFQSGSDFRMAGIRIKPSE